MVRKNNQSRRVVNTKQRRVLQEDQVARIQPKTSKNAHVVMVKEMARMVTDPIRNSVRVRNRELIKEITRPATTGTAQFGADVIDIRFVNSQVLPPASPGTGPLGPYSWLGRTASLYDKYRIVKMKAEFISSMPFTTVGQIGMYFDSDPQAAAPTSFQQIGGGNVYAASVHVSQPLDLMVRPNQLNRLPQYQTSVPATGGDTSGTAGKLIIANTLISTDGVATTLSLGNLWLEYEVEFYNPGNPALATPSARSEQEQIEELNTEVATLKALVKKIHHLQDPSVNKV